MNKRPEPAKANFFINKRVGLSPTKSRLLPKGGSGCEVVGRGIFFGGGE